MGLQYKIALGPSAFGQTRYVRPDSWHRTRKVRWLTIEAWLSLECFRHGLDLVKVGKGVDEGALTLMTDDERWQEVAEDMIRSAEWIFVTPAESAGTLWELERIHDLRKWKNVILLIPPKRWNKRVLEKPEMSGYSQIIRIVLQKFDADLRDDSGKGGVGPAGLYCMELFHSGIWKLRLVSPWVPVDRESDASDFPRLPELATQFSESPLGASFQTAKSS